MPPQQLTLIRHAQGFHNLAIEGHQLHDPRLTLAGRQQCRHLAWRLEDIHSIDCVVASPLLRSLYTALLVFEDVLRFKPNLRIIALPELQETSDLPCDIGSSVVDLEKEFRTKPVDLSLVPHDWTDKVTGIFSPQSSCIAARCRKVRHFLASLRAKNVAVVTHGALLHYLTDDWHGATSGVGTGWYNCEARIYRFDMSTDSSIVDAAIVETEESQLKRQLTTNRFWKQELPEMKKEAEASWASDGYIALPDTNAKPNATAVDNKYGSASKPFTEQLAFKQLGENLWSTLHPPQRMANALPIAYGGYALAVACKAACLSVPDGYQIYSFMGNYLGPATIDRPLLATTRTVRQTRTFATRHVEVSQKLDNGDVRVCLFATADFQAKEKGSMFEYSRSPSKTYSHHAGLPSTIGTAANLLAAGKISKDQYDAFAKTFALGASLFHVHPCPEGVFAQNLTGLAKNLPHSQDDLPLASRSSADWFRSSSPLLTPIDHLAALAFYTDGGLSFCPLSFSHLYLEDSAACSSLDFSLRFFGDIDMEKWQLREISTHAGSGGRTYSECWVWDEQGKAVACMSQQSIMRVLPEKGKL
ncbi:acyl-thioesterase ii [Stagonosporopsis vannaccii]|nr:acyl-thioesterase ii [Stagonosporopsis vannaccii]